MCNFADDTTFYSCDLELKEVIRRLEHDTLVAIEWFGWNNMKLNEDKCHLIVSGHKYEHIWAKAGSAKIWESQREQLLGVYLDRDLSFKYHVTNLCKKTNKKLAALIRLSRYYNFDQRRVLIKSIVESQFGHARLAWMFHDRGVNNQIDKIHERALRFVYTGMKPILLRSYWRWMAQLRFITETSRQWPSKCSNQNIILEQI